MSKYDSMSIEKLEEEKTRLSAEKDKILAEQLKIVAAMESKTAEKTAREKVEGMTNAEKKLVPQILEEAGGIGSSEAVGEPGTDK